MHYHPYDPEREIIGEFHYHNGEWWQHDYYAPVNYKWQWVAGEWKEYKPLQP